MKRFGSLFVLLLVYGVFAGGAEAKKVESQRVAQTPEEVAAYWTDERMRGAKPAERKPKENAKGGGAGGGKKPAAGSATEVPAPYTAFPTATNGKVFFTDNGVNYVCSGTALAGLTGRVVWTAGHCVNEGPGDYFTNWAFVPAYRDGARPYGTWSATSLHTTSAWQSSGDLSYDLGAARVAEPSRTATLTATIGGGRTPAFNYARSQRYNAYGYPAGTPFNGQRLWMCDSSLYMNDTNRSPQTMGIQCNMTGGSSGGGWVVPTDGKVYSVNSYGYGSLRNVMFGPWQGEVAQELYTTADTPPPAS
jgi:hypothetical protein